MNQVEQTKCCYKFAPIKELVILANVLGISKDELLSLAANASQSYHVREEQKEGGGTRTIVNARPLLKRIQRSIKTSFLDHVIYPRYLMGGIKDEIYPRDYKRNAELHSKAVILIREDILNYFPSITVRHIFSIWREFFRFAPAVAECLTKLTTRNGELPQGASTSNHLSNIIFWKCEPELYADFTGQGLRYSRIIDDVIVSSPKRRLDSRELATIVAKIYAMFGRNGFKPKRVKHGVESQAGRITVNKVIANRRASLSREKQSAIRAVVKRCEATPLNQHNTHAYRKLFLSAVGSVGTLKRFHRLDAERLLQRLHAVRPQKVGGTILA